jgi:hypothetical protein
MEMPEGASPRVMKSTNGYGRVYPSRCLLVSCRVLGSVMMSLGHDTVRASMVVYGLGGPAVIVVDVVVGWVVSPGYCAVIVVDVVVG